MISTISEKITKRLITNNVISEDDFELYHYGLFLMLSELWLLSYTAVIASIFKMLGTGLIFFAAFFLIRRYAGGFHAKTELQCQIISLSSILLTVIFAKYLLASIDSKCLLIINAICLIITAFLSPVDTFEKELTADERKKFKKITVAIGSTLLFVNVLTAYFNIHFISIGIASSYLLESVLLIFGKIFNKSKKRAASV